MMCGHGLTRTIPSGNKGGTDMADINPFATATELLAALRAGQVTSLELTDLYIRRIERHDGRLNAVVVRDLSAPASRRGLPTRPPPAGNAASSSGCRSRSR